VAAHRPDLDERLLRVRHGCGGEIGSGRSRREGAAAAKWGGLGEKMGLAERGGFYSLGMLRLGFCEIRGLPRLEVGRKDHGRWMYVMPSNDVVIFFSKNMAY
jgi:hypothetical protein